MVLGAPASPTPAWAAVTEEQLADHTVPGLDPANTTVNLFNYSTGRTGANANAGTDTLGTTGSATPSTNYQTWLANPDSINYGRLLLFGDGMRHLGYWNQGLVESYGEIARENAGMQGIVERSLSASGFPVMSAADGDGYNVNQTDYSTARRTTGSNTSPNEMIYGNAGPLYWSNLSSTVGNGLFDPVWARNIDPVVQAQALSVANGDGDVSFSALGNDTNPSTAATKTALENSAVVNFKDGYDLSEDIRSLQYLFDPDTDSVGKESFKNVTGLFQMDDQGYYFYNMRKNFAEFTPQATGDSAGHFTLYDAPAGLRTDGTDSVGNFFPFNSAENAFVVGADGSLQNALNASNQGNAEPVDHHLGMTVETMFRQPIGGTVGANPMTFEFAGDDDVWVFIDDVLVLDLGGIHSEVYGTIDFATGEVCMGPAFDSHGIPDDPAAGATDKTTIRAMFEAAGHGDAVRFKGDTFASNTSHTLKMFYLERGNYDSSIAVRFNLQPALYQQIQKVDQYGNPLAGAEFDLYAARPCDNTTPTVATSADFGLGDVEVVGDALTYLVTDDKGIARFEDPTSDSAEPFNFSDRYDAATGEGLLYILRETKAPAGYRSVPQDLLLRFEPDDTMLVVNNRYQTGAYASFVSRVVGNTGSIHYGESTADGTLIEAIPGVPVPADVQRDGLVMVVPMLKEPGLSGWSAWMPLWGDNLTGFKGVSYDAAAGDYAAQVRTATLEGALMQAAAASASDGVGTHAVGWYLGWDDDAHRLSALLENMPGRADRYLLLNPDGDMRSFYAVAKPAALARALGVSEADVARMTSEERYGALGRKAAEALAADGGQAGTHFSSLVACFTPGSNDLDARGWCALDSQEFVREFRSRIYVPNEQRELRVVKVDQNGKARDGARFALYDSREKAEANDPAAAVAQGETATVEGTEGLLVFEPHEGHSSHEGTRLPGYADMTWPDTKLGGQAATYWLREVEAPAGCELNPTIVEVKAGVYSIYADAGTHDDGVKVMAGVGKLAQTMVKYASEGKVNVTLRDITSFAQHQDSGSFTLDGWQDTALPDTGTLSLRRSMDLHYGVNAVVDYGLSDEDGGQNYQPFFVADTGYVRTRVQQNLHAHDDPADPFHSTAEADDLGDLDITGLFSLVNTVVVTDRDPSAPGTGSLVLSKRVAGEGLTEADYLRAYHFEVRLLGVDGAELTGSYHFYGRDRSGYLKSGDVVPLAHEEELVVLGLPEGATWSVTEREANTDGFWTRPSSGTLKGVIEADGTHEAAFVNTKGTRPADPTVVIEKDQARGDGDFTREVLDVAAGDIVTYRLTATNSGEGPAFDVRIEDDVPAGLTYVEGSASDGGTCTDGHVAWAVGDLAPGEHRSVTFKVMVPAVTEPTAWLNIAAEHHDDGDGGRTPETPSNDVVIKTPVDGVDPEIPTAPTTPTAPQAPAAAPGDPAGSGSQTLPATGSGRGGLVVPILGDPAFVVPLALVVLCLLGMLFTWMLFPRRR